MDENEEVDNSDDGFSEEKINKQKTKSKWQHITQEKLNGSLEYMVNNHLTPWVEPRTKVGYCKP